MKAPKDQWVIQIDVTNACVHSCSNCTRFCGFHKKPFFMDYDYFCQAVDSLEGHPGLIGVMGGEPTLHPHFKDMCNYLQNKIPEQYRVNDRDLMYPTDSFIEVRRRSELKQYEIHEYSDGPRPIIQGAGLWTSMTRLYRDNLEIIQDTFNFQNLNDHNNISYHQPVLISRKDMDIDDDAWEKLRNKCWINQEWSGSITPKGCFFCEVAGALDMLYDGPGGLPLENGWWKKDINEFKEQFHWCEYCGIPLKTFARDAREQVTDISKTNYDLIKDKETFHFDENAFNLLEIKDGNISEKSKTAAKKYHGISYMEDAQKRVSRNTPIYPKRITGVLLCDDICELNYEAISKNLEMLDYIYVVSDGRCVEIIDKKQKKQLEDIKVMTCSDLREAFGKNEYLLLFTPEIELKKSFGHLIKCVINPGVLHYYDFGKNRDENFYLNSLDGENGRSALISSNAISLENPILSEIPLNTSVFDILIKDWAPQKRIVLSEKMNRTMYGVKSGQVIFQTSLRRINDGIAFLIKCFGRYGIGKTLKYGVFFLRKYGIKLTRQKIKNRIM